MGRAQSPHLPTSCSVAQCFSSVRGRPCTRYSNSPAFSGHASAHPAAPPEFPSWWFCPPIPPRRRSVYPYQPLPPDLAGTRRQDVIKALRHCHSTKTRAVLGFPPGTQRRTFAPNDHQRRRRDLASLPQKRVHRDAVRVSRGTVPRLLSFWNRSRRRLAGRGIGSPRGSQ